MAIPDVTPLTTPPLLTVATPVLLLLHVPPGTGSLSVMDDPAHTWSGPVMALGEEFTVTVTEREQPVPEVYIIGAVPGDTPVTTPPPLTVAIPVAPLLHVPPIVASLSVVVSPTHIVKVPLIGSGNGFTTIVVVV